MLIHERLSLILAPLSISSQIKLWNKLNNYVSTIRILSIKLNSYNTFKTGAIHGYINKLKHNILKLIFLFAIRIYCHMLGYIIVAEMRKE